MAALLGQRGTGLSSLVCDHHLRPLQGHLSSQRPPPWVIRLRRWGSNFLTHLEFYLPFSPVGDSSEGVTGPKGRWGSGRRGSFSLETGRHLLRRLLRPLSSGAGGMEAQALQRARGELNHRRRTGREANVHRLSVPTPGQVVLQVGPVFTCLLSQVAQTRAPFLSCGARGAALAHPGPQSLAPALCAAGRPLLGEGCALNSRNPRREGPLGK